MRSSSLRLMVHPLPPDEARMARRGLRQTIQNLGFDTTLKNMVRAARNWKEDPDSASARLKKRTSLLFTDKELREYFGQVILQIIDDSQFISANATKRVKRKPKQRDKNATSGRADCTFELGPIKAEWPCPDPEIKTREVVVAEIKDYATCTVLKIVDIFKIFITPFFTWEVYWDRDDRFEEMENCSPPG